MRFLASWMALVVVVPLLAGCGVTRKNLREAKPAPSVELLEEWMNDQELHFERQRVDEKVQYGLWLLPFESDYEDLSWDVYVEIEEIFVTYVIWLRPVTQALGERTERLNLALFAVIGRMNFNWNQVKVGLDESFEPVVSLEFPTALLDRDEFIGNLYFCVDKADEFTGLLLDLMRDPSLMQEFDHPLPENDPDDSAGVPL